MFWRLFAWIFEINSWFEIWLSQNEGFSNYCYFLKQNYSYWLPEASFQTGFLNPCFKLLYSECASLSYVPSTMLNFLIKISLKYYQQQIALAKYFTLFHHSTSSDISSIYPKMQNPSTFFCCCCSIEYFVRISEACR